MTDLTKPMSQEDRDFLAKAMDLVARIKRPRTDAPVDFSANSADTVFLSAIVTKLYDAMYDNNVASMALGTYSEPTFWTDVIPSTSAAKDLGATARWAKSLIDPV